MSTRDKLLADIEAYLAARPELSPARFGIEALNDHKFVARHRANPDRGVTSTTIDLVYAYIAANPVAKKKRESRRIAA